MAPPFITVNLPSVVLPLDILADVSFVLIEPYVDTALGTAIGAPGIATVTPPSMVGIIAGALLAIARGQANAEVVTVSSVSATQFTATFANTHAATDAVNGPTFSSGMFTQAEMLEYLYNVENEFLLKVRPVFGNATEAIGTGPANRYYPQPSNAIRIERVFSNGKAWMDTSQMSLDLDNPIWQTVSQSTDPRAWFQDDINLEQWGIYPLVDIGGIVAELWCSVKETNANFSLLTPFVLPDIFTMYLKYGVLARAFAKDGEQRDATRAKYCQSRFDFGVMLAQRFLKCTEAIVREMQADQEQQKFSPMAVGVK